MTRLAQPTSDGSSSIRTASSGGESAHRRRLRLNARFRVPEPPFPDIRWTPVRLEASQELDLPPGRYSFTARDRRWSESLAGETQLLDEPDSPNLRRSELQFDHTGGVSHLKFSVKDAGGPLRPPLDRTNERNLDRGPTVRRGTGESYRGRRGSPTVFPRDPKSVVARCAERGQPRNYDTMRYVRRRPPTVTAGTATARLVSADHHASSTMSSTRPATVVPIAAISSRTSRLSSPKNRIEPCLLRSRRAGPPRCGRGL